MTDSLIPHLPCGQRPAFIRDNFRIEPEGFKRHVQRCARCADLVDAIRVVLSPVTRAVFSPTEAANMLNLSPRTLYRKIESGDIQAYRIGTRLRIRWADMEDWLDGCKL
jgi:excisionase family DNA binding protein